MLRDSSKGRKGIDPSFACHSTMSLMLLLVLLKFLSGIMRHPAGRCPVHPKTASKKL